MREPARSARSDTGRESAFFKRSAASWVMSLFYSEKAQLRLEPKNPYTCLWRIAIFAFLRISRPATHSAKRNLVVLFIHFNAFARLLPASRASGRSPVAHA